MKATFFDYQDAENPLNGRDISTPDEALAILDPLAATREPFICCFEAENGFSTTVGVGPFGCVQHSASDGSPPYLVAVGAMEGDDRDTMEFLCGGTATPISRRHCLDWTAVREVVAHFVDHGARSPDVAWEDV